MREAPCKDCQDRFENCHKYCSGYYLFKQDRKRIAALKEKERVSTPELPPVIVKQIWKELKK